MKQDHLPARQLAGASLLTLAVLQGAMMLAMMTLTRPHPPLTVPLFALGPFLGAAIALAIGAYAAGSVLTRIGWWASLMAGLLAMVSYGPHKWFDPVFPQIWPSVILGQLAFLALMVAMFQARRYSAEPSARASGQPG